MAISLRTVSNPGSKHPFKITFTNNAKKQKGSKESVVLTLVDPEDQKFITGQVSDETNVWNDVIINVRDLLRAQSDDNIAFPVSHITMYTCAITPGSVSQLRSVLIMAPWSEKTVLTYYPYDLNGITTRNWQGGYIENTFSPADIKPHTPGDNWMKIRFGDAAGNQTDVQMIPLLPALPPDTKKK
jgi:hypothetical protein